MTNVLPLSLQSAIYSCPHRTSWFLEAMVTTRTTTTLPYNTTTQEISCRSAHQVLFLMLWESTTPIYLAIYGCCSQQFLCYCSYECTCLDHKLELCGQDSARAYVYPWCHACDKMYQALSPTLAGRAWEWGWEWDCEILHTCPILVVYCHRWLKGAPRVHSVHVNIPKLWKFVTSFPDSSPAI